MASALLAACGVLFGKLNLGAEMFEPEALAAAKEEDDKVDNAR